MSNQSPSTEEWAALYRAAADFKQIAAWEWMYDSDLFGVRDPASGEIGYCCVMGNLGEHFALGVYLGTEGLNGYLMIAAGELAGNAFSILHHQKCLMASYEDRDLIEKQDLAVIKALGLKYRGRNAWPQFRSYEPDLVPWFLTAEQARFLTVALQQSCDVALRYRDDPDLLAPPEQSEDEQEDDIYLVRVPEPTEAGLSWSDQWMAPAPLQQEAQPLPPIDELRIQRIKQAITKRYGTWEGDFFLSPTPIQEHKGQRPYYPYTVLWVDQRSGMVLAPHLTTPDRYQAEFQSHLLGLIEQARVLPQELAVAQQEAFDLLEPITSRLKIKLHRANRLVALESARNSFMSMFEQF